jgi:hypothetical protein
LVYEAKRRYQRRQRNAKRGVYFPKISLVDETETIVAKDKPPSAMLFTRKVVIEAPLSQRLCLQVVQDECVVGHSITTLGELVNGNDGPDSHLPQTTLLPLRNIARQMVQNLLVDKQSHVRCVGKLIDTAQDPVPISVSVACSNLMQQGAPQLGPPVVGLFAYNQTQKCYHLLDHSESMRFVVSLALRLCGFHIRFVVVQWRWESTRLLGYSSPHMHVAQGGRFGSRNRSCPR